MKKTALLLAALAAGASLYAQESSSYSVTVDFPYASKYVFRGIQYAEDSVQPSVEFATGNFYAGVWTNQPLTSNIDNEVDFYAGYGLALTDTWKLDAGVTMYYYPEQDSSLGLDRETYEGYVGLTGAVAGFTPAFYAYYDFTLENFTYQGSVGYSIPLGDQFSLDPSVTVGYVDNDVGTNYTYWGIGVNLPYKLTDRATVTLGGQYAGNDLDDPEIDDELFYVTAGITLGL